MRMQPSWSGVHTNRGNKVLLIQTPGVKMSGSFARGVVGQLQVGHIQEALGSGGLHATRRTLFTPRAARAFRGASLAFFWVLPELKRQGTEFTERDMWKKSVKAEKHRC